MPAGPAPGYLYSGYLKGRDMVEQITDQLVAMNKEMAVVILAALPISELRGAIPLAIAMDFSPVKAYLLAFAGNLIPVIPILFLLQPVAERFRHIKIVGRFFDWLFERTRRKAALVEKFEVLGLILFVAIPFPGTGAYTGSVITWFFKIRRDKAIPTMMVAVVAAGVVVTLASIGFISFIS